MGYYADNEKKTEVLLNQADRLAEEIFQTESSIKEYLSFSMRLSGSLEKNKLLIRAQKPDAQWAMTFQEWKRQGISVKKGEKGLRILLPEEGEGGLIAYRTEYVFDISQLDITEKQREEMLHARQDEARQENNIERMYGDLVRAARTYGIEVAVSREETGTEPSAIYPRDNAVFLNPDLTAAEKYMRALRDVSMVILEREDRWGLEALRAQADMVSYLVCRFYGAGGDHAGLPDLSQIQFFTTAQKEQILEDVSWVFGSLQKELSNVLYRVEQEELDRKAARADTAAARAEPGRKPLQMALAEDPGKDTKTDAFVEVRENQNQGAADHKKEGRAPASAGKTGGAQNEEEPDKKKGGKIQDFGEKIGGAKKDLWKERGLGVEDLSDMNEAEAAKYITKDNIWKKPDYSQMMEDGLPPRVAFFIKEVRNALPVKAAYSCQDGSTEQIRERREDYIRMVQYFRDHLMSLKSEREITGFWDKVLDEGVYLKRAGGVWAARTKAGFAITGRLMRAMYVRDFWQIDRKMEKEQFQKAKEEKIPAGYSIRRDEAGWQVMKRSRLLAEGLQTEQEALAWAKDHDKTARSARKKKFIPPQLEQVVRDGPDYGISEGTPADGERYLADFGFRGGEFGNWMSDKDRQASLNMGYDALSDLAGALQIPVSDISLGNRLSIAFGSRGQGGAVAHYEPQREVINLTKMRGAGSLAHEWGHAFDDLAGRRLGVDGMMTAHSGDKRLPKSMEKVLEAMQLRPATEEEHAERTQRRLAVDRQRFHYLADSLLPTKALDEKQKEEWGQLKEKAVSVAVRLADLPEAEQQTAGEQIDGLVEGLGQYIKKTTGRTINREAQIRLCIMLANIKNDCLFAKQEDFVESDFYLNAVKADAQFTKESKGYWKSPAEMFARAFACYVKDKLTWRSDYLCGHADACAFTELGTGKVCALYPQGEERQRINRAIDGLIAECKQMGILQDRQQGLEIGHRRAGRRR